VRNEVSVSFCQRNVNYDDLLADVTLSKRPQSDNKKRTKRNSAIMKDVKMVLSTVGVPEALGKEESMQQRLV